MCVLGRPECHLEDDSLDEYVRLEYSRLMTTARIMQSIIGSDLRQDDRISDTLYRSSVKFHVYTARRPPSFPVP